MVVDDHPAFRMGLIALIESQPDMAVVAECGNGLEAVEMFRQVRPDVTLMDLRLPGQSGVEAILTIQKEFPEGRIIVITTFDCDEDIYRACESGAKAYLFKDASKDEIINAIRTVHAGQRWLPTKVASRLDECLKRPKLSGREMDVLQGLAKGRSNKEIASTLFLSEDTVKTHLKTLFVKLQVPDRTSAVITAIRHGIVHLE
jgi:DNA-binding NarL/FixJ family response regulator